METAMGAIVAAVSGVNNISGHGMLDFESCQSLEKLVLDHEICGMALRLARGVALRDDPIALPLIKQGLEKKEFLSLSHTTKWFRKEAYFPDPVIERGALEEWRAKGKKDAFTRARERVDAILAKHRPEPLDAATVTHLRGLMSAEAKRYGMDRLPE
jgi:trimethylamine--corrinoid protein Co-methyltransferase